MTGNNIYISTTSSLNPIAGTKSNNLVMKADIIETSSASPNFKTFIAGRKEWEISTDYLITTSSDISKLLYVGNSYYIYVVYRSGSTKTTKLYGTAICQQAEIQSVQGNLVKGSFSFKGTGSLSE